MQFQKLVTYSFDPNVGSFDRILRTASGAALAASPLLVSMPTWAAAIALAFGLAWTATGVVSRCGMYYVLGYSTCAMKEDAR